MPKYPQPSDYQIAIQNPNLVLREPDLRTARVRLDRLGMPVVSSGGFALSFYLQAEDESQWVVRCFKADSPDRQARYAAISRFLNLHPDPLLLDVDYVEEGILVNGAWYPIVRMPLVHGVTIQRCIEAQLAAFYSVGHLSRKFRALVDRLQQLKIAHGDLQHGNIMVQNGELVLVDYDGMYVPALRGWAAAEMGSAAYQHPLRQDQFSPTLDRFSAIVIDMALQALAAAPGLWAKYNTGENILFNKTDFSAPESSSLLHDLEQIPHLREAVHRLRRICQGPFDAIPRLEDVLPPLPDDVQPMTLPGIPLVVTSPFTWDTGDGGAGAGDVDAQLTRLYTNWIPTTPGTNWSATGTPIALPFYGSPGVLQPRSNVPGPLTPPTPLLPPAPKPSPKPSPQPAHKHAAAAPQHGGKHHALSHSAQGKHEPHLLGKAGRIIFLLVAIGWLLPRAMSFANMPPAGTHWEFAALLPGFTHQEAPVSPLPVEECPGEVDVYLAAPKTAVQGSLATFSWRGSPKLTERCHYRLKLWRTDGTLIALSAAAANHVTTMPDGYEAVVDMTQDFPPGQQFGGDFVWTVELVDSVHSNEFMLVHSKPQAFTWVPQ
jgi:hypothetical protein